MENQGHLGGALIPLLSPSGCAGSWPWPAGSSVFAAACRTFSVVATRGIFVAACGIQFPDQGSNPSALHSEFGVLTAGPPGKSHLDGYFLLLDAPLSPSPSSRKESRQTQPASFRKLQPVGRGEKGVCPRFQSVRSRCQGPCLCAPSPWGLSSKEVEQVGLVSTPRPGTLSCVSEIEGTNGE